MILKSELEKYINDGWVKGQYKTKINKISTLGTKWMNNGIIHKNIKLDEIDNYLSKGWVFGMIKRNKN